jgi:hypothetical protein
MPVKRQHAKSIEGSSQRIEYTAEHLRTVPGQSRPIAGRDFTSNVKARRFAEGHQQDPMFPKAHHLGPHAEIVAGRTHETDFSEPDIGAIRLDDEPRDPGDGAQTLHRRQVANLRLKHVNERSDF